MREGASVNCSWTTDRGAVNYDTHGDPIDAPRDFYHGYGKATGVASDEGMLEARLMACTAGSGAIEAARQSQSRRVRKATIRSCARCSQVLMRSAAGSVVN